ncbi:MAG: hypothetical protein ACPHXR_06160 [Flavicella sp.]
MINGNLFTHGGIHPDIVKYDISLDAINTISRKIIENLIFHQKKMLLNNL